METFQAKFAETYPDPKETEFTDFYPSLGVPAGTDVEFLVYGQAVGGWHDSIDLAEPVPDGRWLQSKEYSNGTFGSDSPIDWVNARWSPGDLKRLKDEKQREHYAIKDSEYWASRSFFWQLTTRVIQEYSGARDTDWGWSKQLVWSNLYKIARQKENPLDDVKVLQRWSAVELVKRELDELRPKYCLIITSDPWWAPFRRGIKSTVLSPTPEGSIIQSIEVHGATTKIIVIHRPFVGSAAKYAQEIMPHLLPLRS